MLRFLLILIALVVLLRLLGWTPPGVARRKAAGSGGGAADGPTAGSTAAAELVACAQCGVYLPVEQALLQDGARYCCDAHRRQGPRGGRSGRSAG